MGKISKVRLSFKKDAKGIWDKYETTQIKINGVSVGQISKNMREREEFVRVKIQVIKSDIMEDGNKNCVWRWVTFKKMFDSEELARIWIKDNIDGIMEKWNIFIDTEGG